jgi:hypothetical protein
MTMCSIIAYATTVDLHCCKSFASSLRSFAAAGTCSCTSVFLALPNRTVYYCYPFALEQAEYLALDMPTALREAGFELLEIRSSSPSHIALIARKPE